MIITPNILSAMKATNGIIDETSLRLSTGKRLNSASDDPMAFNRVAVTKTSISNTSVSLNVLEHGMNRLDARDQTLGSMQDTLARFQELATMASAGLYKLSDLLPEMKSLEKAMLSLANTKDASGYMFSGDSNIKPFDVDASGNAVYNGSPTAQKISVEGITISGAVAGTPLLGVFQAMRTVIATAEAGTPPTTAMVASVNTATETILSMRTEGAAEGAGAKQVINSLTKRYDREREEVTRLEEADMTLEMTRFTEAQKQYEAIMKITASRLNQRRLMDYL